MINSKIASLEARLSRLEGKLQRRIASSFPTREEFIELLERNSRGWFSNWTWMEGFSDGLPTEYKKSIVMGVPSNNERLSVTLLFTEAFAKGTITIRITTLNADFKKNLKTVQYNLDDFYTTDVNHLLDTIKSMM